MDKEKLRQQIIDSLVQDLDIMNSTAQEARKAATHEEAKAENKYDTRGLEAAYLAGAQAKRAEELRAVIDKLNKLELKDFIEDEPIALTALVRLEDETELERIFFILPYGGGTKVKSNDEEVYVISPQSPIGKRLLGLRAGDSLSLTFNKKTSEHEIVSVE